VEGAHGEVERTVIAIGIAAEEEQHALAPPQLRRAPDDQLAAVRADAAGDAYRHLAAEKAAFEGAIDAHAVRRGGQAGGRGYDREDGTLDDQLRLAVEVLVSAEHHRGGEGRRGGQDQQGKDRDGSLHGRSYLTHDVVSGWRTASAISSSGMPARNSVWWTEEVTSLRFAAGV
jgi:hypothetical protein